MLSKVPMPNIQFAHLRNLILSVFVLAIVFSTGYAFGIKGFYASLNSYPEVSISRELPKEKETLEFSLFWRVWDTLQAKYFDKDKLIPAKMVYGAIKGMVASVEDPYTIFLTPNENRVVQEDLKGNFEGVGIQIGFKGSQLAVVSPLPDSPAEKAGIRAGDYIAAIKDEQKNLERGTVGITLPQAVQAIRGPAGSTVTLTLLREGLEDPLVVDVVRDSIEVSSISVEFIGEDGSIAHVKILKFSAETISEWEEAVLDILTRPGLAGVIIDVRNNPGGYLQGAVDLASDFLENGTTVVVEETGASAKREYKVEKLARLKNQNVVILINAGSASASEIFAGALRDIKKTLLIGETTFGKGTIQEPQQVDGDAGLHITIARWLTPDGTWVNEDGLDPDIEVADDPETDIDEQLEEAIRMLGTGG